MLNIQSILDLLKYFLKEINTTLQKNIYLLHFIQKLILNFRLIFSLVMHLSQNHHQIKIMLNTMILYWNKKHKPNLYKQKIKSFKISLHHNIMVHKDFIKYYQFNLQEHKNKKWLNL